MARRGHLFLRYAPRRAARSRAQVRLWPEGREGVFYAKLPFAPMPESFNLIKAGRISVPDENYTTLNTFCLLVCYMPLDD